MNNHYKIFIFSALECEAKALVSHFNLNKDNSHKAFSVYSNDDVVLTVTGLGKIAMAGGVAYTMALFSFTQPPVMLNVGIAGHKTKPIGTLLSAAKIIDIDSGRAFYPQLLQDGWPQAYEIKTLSKPSEHYSSDSLIDMEASAFYEMAIRFSSSELIHCLKVVSDNEGSSIDQIGPKLVNEWIANQMEGIVQVVNDLNLLSSVLEGVNLETFDAIVNQWHFTVSGKVKLKALLMRWQTLSIEPWFKANTREFLNAKDVMSALKSDIESLDVYL